ncbi:MAG: DUF2807 domain-containing protein [Pseudomonadales bacterium]|nr:DUF2807 domain-containing protein [Halioglobus sp.]MCP5130626.1 DUF2807 domain-containing protein [Pseudomonadales bacterium]
MLTSRWKNLTGSRDSRAFLAAFGLLLCCVSGTAASAEVISVESLQFSRVQLLGSNELEVTQGEANALKIRGDSDDLEPPPFVVEGDMLRLGIRADGESVRDLQFKLTVTDIRELQLKGSGEAFVKPLAVDDLQVEVEGSGEMHMFDVKAGDLDIRVLGSGAVEAVNVQARSARLHVKGSGDIDLGTLEADIIKAHMAGSGDVIVQGSGRANVLEVGVMGSGDVRLKGVEAKTAKVTIMGSGDVEIRVQESLEAEILGSGDLVYFGNPTTSKSVMGSGDITQRDGR